MKKQIANITLIIPYKRAGNIISQEPVDFTVFEDDDHYCLIPCLPEDEIRIANLPTELRFSMQDGKPVSLRGKRDGNFHVIQDAVECMREKKIVAFS
ncbi:MAG TPA: hypothetical protein VF609_03250 [Flavisolibacter sp.]|jgi:hypothetical protein